MKISPSSSVVKALFAVVTFIALAACAQIIPTEFIGPSGKPAYTMKCSGMGRTLDACYQKAGEMCPQGYNIVDRATGAIGVPMQGGGMLMAPTHGLAVECK